MCLLHIFMKRMKNKKLTTQRSLVGAMIFWEKHCTKLMVRNVGEDTYVLRSPYQVQTILKNASETLAHTISQFIYVMTKKMNFLSLLTLQIQN